MVGVFVIVLDIAVVFESIQSVDDPFASHTVMKLGPYNGGVGFELEKFGCEFDMLAHAGVVDFFSAVNKSEMRLLRLGDWPGADFTDVIITNVEQVSAIIECFRW